MKNLVIVLSGVFLIVLLAQYITPSGGMYMMHNFSMYNNITVYLLGFMVIVVVAYLLYELNKKKYSHPMKILDEKLANGKISIEEYEKIRKILSGNDRD